MKTNGVQKTENAKLVIQLLGPDGKIAGEEPLDESVASVSVHPHLLHQYEVAYQANQRQGTVQAKMRSEVSGGGKKPWRQKGTGQARHGSTRSPLWRKGGVVFGPRPYDWGIELPRRMKKQALLAGIKAKAAVSKLYLVDDFVVSSGKTGDCAAAVRKFGLKKPLVVTESDDSMTLRAAGNLKKLSIRNVKDLCAHEVLVCDECVFTRGGYRGLLRKINPEPKA